MKASRWPTARIISAAGDSGPKPMKLDVHLPEHSAEIIKSFIAAKIEESGCAGAVLGLSGGLDSAVVCRLAADALGPKNVRALIIPHSAHQSGDVRDALDFARKTGVRHRIVDIGPLYSSFGESLTHPGRRAHKAPMGNIAARIRMAVIYFHANCESLLVLGTGNKSELLMGYFTKHGDGGVDCQPIGDLYKTQVRQLAYEIGIPKNIIAKVPSAGLWKGQTDEGEMGVDYATLDRVLHGIELGLSAEEIRERSGIPAAKIRSISSAVAKAVHKRKMPLIPKLGVRTLGADWRE